MLPYGWCVALCVEIILKCKAREYVGRDIDIDIDVKIKIREDRIVIPTSQSKSMEYDTIRYDTARVKGMWGCGWDVM